MVGNKPLSDTGGHSNQTPGKKTPAKQTRGGVAPLQAQSNSGKAARFGTGRALAPFLAFVLFGFAIHLLVHQLNIVDISGFPLGFYLAVQGAPIMLATIAFWIAFRRGRDDCKSDALEQGNGEDLSGTSEITNGLATRRLVTKGLVTKGLVTKGLVTKGLAASGELASGAMVVGLAGIAFAQGYDGLAYTLGLMCGLVAMSLFVVPLVEQTSARSVSDLLYQRYRSRTVSVVGALVVGVCLLLLLGAEILVVGVVVSRVFAVGFIEGTMVAGGLTALAVGVCNLGRSVVTVGLAAGSLALLILLCVVSGLLSWASLGIAVPQFGLGASIQEIIGLERLMLENSVADAAFLKQHIRPRLHFDAVNFFAIVASICFGIAVLPVRALYGGGGQAIASADAPERDRVRDRDATTSITMVLAWCAFFVCLVVITIPAMAAFGKVELYRALAAGISLASLPAWVASYGAGELVSVCGQSDLSASNLSATCAEQTGHLTLQDIALHRDATLLAVAEFGSLSFGLVLALAGTILFCALVAGARISLLAMSEFADAFGVGGLGVLAGRRAIFTVGGIGMVGVGAIVAATSGIDVLTLIVWSACLAASTLFPAIVLGHLWPRVGPIGVASAMITGAVVWAFYCVGTTYFASSFAMSWQTISSAPSWQLAELADLLEKCGEGGTNWASDCGQITERSREAANWFGIENTASAIFAMPAAVFVLSLFGAISAIGRFFSKRQRNT